MSTKKSKKFKAVSKFNNLIDQIFNNSIIITETETGGEQLDSVVLEFTTKESVLNGRTVFEYLKQDLKSSMTEEEYETAEKGQDGKFLIFGFQLTEKLTKANYNRMAVFSKFNKYDLMLGRNAEEVEDLFYESFERIVSDGKEIDLEFLTAVDMVDYLDNFIRVMTAKIKEFKKK